MKKPKNRYLARAKISEARFRRFIRAFALDLEATKIANLTGLNRNTVNRLTRLVRVRIAEHAIAFAAGPWWQHNDRPAGMRFTLHAGSPRPRPSFLVLLNERREVALFPEGPPRHPGRELVIDPPPDWCDLAGLPPPAPDTALQARRVVEAFWLSVRQRLAKFRGLPGASVELHLRESEFRFNRRGHNLEEVLMELFRHRGFASHTRSQPPAFPPDARPVRYPRFPRNSHA